MLHNNNTEEFNDIDPVELFRAVERGDVDELRRLIKLGLSIHTTDANGNNLVLQAIAHGQSLILDELIKSKKKGGFGLSLNVINNYHSDAVLVSIANRQEILFKKLIEKKKNGGYGLSLNVKNIYKSGPVLTAIGAGSIPILNFLTNVHELSIDVKNINGYGPIEIAVINNDVEMIEVLIKDKKYGGYGFTLTKIDYLIDLAYGNSCKDTFLWLFKYEISKRIHTNNCNEVLLWSTDALDNYEKHSDCLKLILSDIYNQRIEYYLKKQLLNMDEFYFIHELCKSQVQISDYDGRHFTKTFMDEFNRKLFDVNYKTAMTWATNILDGFDLYYDEVVVAITERFKKMLANEFNKTHFETRNCYIINSVVKALDYLAAGQGQIILANFYIQHFCFANAFQHYLAIYNNFSCDIDMRETAGFELANLIYNGFVVLADGELDVTNTLKRSELVEATLKIEDKDLSIMQQRAIQAYEYLHGNSSNDAKTLKNRLNNILSDDLTMGDKKNICWSKKATTAFHQYYKTKNPTLSKEIQLYNKNGIASTGLGIFKKAAAHNVMQHENQNHKMLFVRTTT